MKNKKYKAGDVVHIRKDLATYNWRKYKNSAHVVWQMHEFAGMTATITGAVGINFFRLDIDSNKWVWSEDMFSDIHFSQDITGLLQMIDDM